MRMIISRVARKSSRIRVKILNKYHNLALLLAKRVAKFLIGRYNRCHLGRGQAAISKRISKKAIFQENN